MLTSWKILMLCILPLMMWGVKPQAWLKRLGDPKPRTWLALLGGSVVAVAVPFNYVAYALVDMLTAAVILSRPAGEEQKAIGTICAGMAISSLGFYLGGAGQPGAFAEFLSILGWLQFAILVAWGLNDNFGHRFRGAGAAGRSRAADKRRV